MEYSLVDFLKSLGNDLLLSIFKRLDLSDVVRASAISRDWQDFVIGSELSKLLCISHFPQVANVVDVHDVTSRKRKRSDDVGSSENGELLARNHKVYTSLLQVLQTLMISSPVDCQSKKYSSSFYQNKRKKDDNAIPEKFIFKLKSDQCLITEIIMKPYREYMKEVEEEEDYSTKSVRFRMGFPKSAPKKRDAKRFAVSKDPADKFIWTYTSPEFPVSGVCYSRQGQRFELPEPVLHIGGYVMVELLGRVQMHANIGPYYIKLAGVNVMGRSLSPAFTAEVQDISGKFELNYNSGRLSQTTELSFRGGRPGKQRIRKQLATCACECQLVEINE